MIRVAMRAFESVCRLLLISLDCSRQGNGEREWLGAHSSANGRGCEVSAQFVHCPSPGAERRTKVSAKCTSKVN